MITAGGGASGGGRDVADHRPGSLAERFDPRANGLNLIRLLLAVSVVVWHAFPLTGREIDAPAIEQLVSEVGVDGFFAISGFLILRSWRSTPRLVPFLWARVLRIMPGYWVCLVVVAALGPALLSAISGAGVPAVGASVRYVLGNSYLRQAEAGIGGTPTDVPYEGIWNGSLWTLQWEFALYLVVAVLGVLALAARRGVGVVVCALAVVVLAVVDGTGTVLFKIDVAARLAVMFSAGMAVLDLAPVLRPTRWTVGGSVLLLVGGLALPDYRLVAALPLAFLLIAASTLVRSPRLQLRTDISYGMYIYAFPVQQLLAATALVTAPVGVFAVVSVLATAPLAYASFRLVERPAMRLRRRPPPRVEAPLSGTAAPSA